MEVIKIQFQTNLLLNESVKIEWKKPGFSTSWSLSCGSVDPFLSYRALLNWLLWFLFDFLLSWVSKAKEQLLIVLQILPLIPIPSPCIVFPAPALPSPRFLDLRIGLTSSLAASIHIENKPFSIPVLNYLTLALPLHHTLLQRTLDAFQPWNHVPLIYLIR